MNNTSFIGRKNELRKLNDLLEKKVASLVVIRGRRRIGKSRLIQEFARDKKYYQFTGLAPSSDTTSQMQRDEFSRQLNLQTGIPEGKFDSWGKLFLLLADKVKSGRVILLFDEISWMGSKDPEFLGQLKLAWDQYFKQNPELILILCGSVSSWIEKNIISSTAFFGRIALKITLQELTLSDCNLLLDQIGFHRSSQEKFQIFSVTGGVPWYIELIKPQYSAIENIRELCFTYDGVLVNEFNTIFHDLYGRRGDICKKIVTCLMGGQLSYSEIASELKYPSGGPLSDYIRDLEVSGFVNQDYVWSLKNGDVQSISSYRLSDNYVRFYLKYIAPKLQLILTQKLRSLPNFLNLDSIMGLQFENLVLNNREKIFSLLGIRPEEVVFDNPFFQRKTSKQQGCQIDYLIQTRYNTLFACEIKFSKNEITSSVTTEMKKKLSKLLLPHGFACLPVLIHVNGVNVSVEESRYFYKIIDFSQLLSE